MRIASYDRIDKSNNEQEKTTFYIPKFALTQNFST